MVAFGKKKKKPETPAEKVRRNAPRSLITPCRTCFWRIGDECTLEINPKGGKCYQYRPEKKSK